MNILQPRFRISHSHFISRFYVFFCILRCTELQKVHRPKYVYARLLATDDKHILAWHCCSYGVHAVVDTALYVKETTTQQYVSRQRFHRLLLVSKNEIIIVES